MRKHSGVAFGTCLRLMVAAYLCLSNGSARTIQAEAQEEKGSPGLLFSEGFDDVDLRIRGWYDGDRFKIVDDGAGAAAIGIRT